jgi:histidinol-phosphate/aromatic aminotransferase/cobyric acid decarboxylase-like protein
VADDNIPPGAGSSDLIFAGLRHWVTPASRVLILDPMCGEYACPAQSLEAYASGSANVVICKSMSKVYALSGVRAAYLCGPRNLMEERRSLCPPWSVSLPAQMAACEALKAQDDYGARWEETHQLRDELREHLLRLGRAVVPGYANFLLCHLPKDGPDAATLARALRTRRLFVRDVSNMGTGFDGRAVRIAVKDRHTNLWMIEILETILAEMNGAVTHAA